MIKTGTNIHTAELTLTLESYRCHGEEKLKRPACLKGLKPVWELPIIGKKCKVFELENGDLMLHMGELFCKQMSFPEAEDMTMPTVALMNKYPERFTRKSVKGFVYADAWCTIYNRNEGYIRIAGLRESLSDIFGLKLGPIYDAVYDGLRRLSLLDARFLPLGLTGGEGADSADYRRLCENIVGHYFVLERGKYRKENNYEPENQEEDIHQHVESEDALLHQSGPDSDKRIVPYEPPALKAHSFRGGMKTQTDASR